MNFLKCFLFTILPLPLLGQADAFAPLQVFAPDVVSLPDIRETSPSITADGKTLVFARTENWRDKVPFIATRDGDRWTVARLPITDTLYNLAITPDGSAIFFKKYEPYGDTTISRTYRVERKGDSWGTPRNLPALEDINAGYFCPMADGALYLFARRPKPGIYLSTPRSDGSYSPPEYLSDAVSIPNTTSFDVLMHPDRDRLIITRAGIPEEQAEDLGPRGYYYYERKNGSWQAIKRLSLPYGWGATVLPDDRLLVVEEGDLQTASLIDLGIDWP